MTTQILVLVEDAPNASELERVLRGLNVASARFRSETGRPANLVVDNFTKLAKDDPQAFKRLVEFAKYEADEGNLVVTFVASEGHTPRRLAGTFCLIYSDQNSNIFLTYDCRDERILTSWFCR